MNFPLNAPSEVNLTIAHNSQEANAIYTLLQTTMPCLRVSRNGSGVFFGVMTSCESALDDDGVMNVSFTDWVGTWANCYRNEMSSAWINSAIYVAVEAIDSPTDVYYLGSNGAGTGTTMSSRLITMTGIPGTINIVSNTLNIPPSATLFGNWGKSISLLDHIQELAAATDYGFEWYCDVDPSTGQCRMNLDNVSVGTNKSSTVRFGFGNDLGKATLSNCTAVQTSFLPPVNYVYIEENDDGRASQVLNSTSVTNYGEWGIQGNPQPTKTKAVSYSNGLLRPNPRQQVVLTANATLAPQPWTDYYLGDTVGVRVQRDALSIDSNYRVNQISITLDDNMIDTAHQISFEAI